MGLLMGKSNCVLYAIIHRSNEQPTEFENRVTWLKSNLNMMNIYKVNWHKFLDVTVIQWMNVQLSSHRIVFFITNRNKKKVSRRIMTYQPIVFSALLTQNIIKAFWVIFGFFSHNGQTIGFLKTELIVLGHQQR